MLARERSGEGADGYWVATSRPESRGEEPAVMVIVTVTMPFASGADAEMAVWTPPVLDWPLDFHSVRSVDHW